MALPFTLAETARVVEGVGVEAACVEAACVACEDDFDFTAELVAELALDSEAA